MARIVCSICEGKGFYEEPRDLHKSGGIVKCFKCNGKGWYDAVTAGIDT